MSKRSDNFDAAMRSWDVASKAAEKYYGQAQVLKAALQRFIDDEFKDSPVQKGERHCYWCGKRTWEGETPSHRLDCPVVIAREALSRIGEGS